MKKHRSGSPKSEEQPFHQIIVFELIIEVYQKWMLLLAALAVDIVFAATQIIDNAL
jgi:hypothetical protein